ncbi:hypothetical protein C1H46_026765 [Malus baccata]|uniref:Histone deacetylase complex subunit SAP18 n=1 Tax=Malus baccata TaxID=106549 RepID=A0A540LMG1_MALBA|nr:hypothetical protein C1H46_026765 [Malus baccata]
MAEAAQGPRRALPPPGRGPRFGPVDREKTCPLLLRVFTKTGSHRTNADFAVRGKEPKDEVQIYTWKDATLLACTRMFLTISFVEALLYFHNFGGSKLVIGCAAFQVKEVAPAARRRNARLSFAFVYPDKHGHFVVREVGKTLSNGNGKLDDGKVLAELGFQRSLGKHTLVGQESNHGYHRSQGNRALNAMVSLPRDHEDSMVASI